MKGTATIIGLISGRSSVRGQVRGRQVCHRTCPLTGAADGLPMADGSASRTRETGLYHYLHVWPEQPQELVWLTPQVGIDYQIETSTDLEWQIK